MPRIPTQNTRFIDPQAERARGMLALEAIRGYAGAPSQASVMSPGANEAYTTGETAALLGAMIPFAGMGKAALGGLGKTALAGIIAPGRKALRADYLPKSYVAEEMLTKGIDPWEVWRKTGWFRSPDGQMRFEIPDDELSFVNIPSHQWQPSYQGLIFDADRLLKGVSHPELEDAYPELMKNYGLTLEKIPLVGKSRAKGQHVPPDEFDIGGDIEITSSDENKARSTLVHELQHAVQAFEGFEPGGSPKNFPGLSPEEARNKYIRLMGEAEARAAQARRNMTSEQRKKTFPLESYDVPIESLIRKGQGYAEGGLVHLDDLGRALGR